MGLLVKRTIDEIFQPLGEEVCSHDIVDMFAKMSFIGK